MLGEAKQEPCREQPLPSQKREDPPVAAPLTGSPVQEGDIGAGNPGQLREFEIGRYISY
jgi:hypothetical protein